MDKKTETELYNHPIARRLRMARHFCNLTVEEMAAQCSLLTAAQLREYETGMLRISEEELVYINSCLRLLPPDFFHKVLTASQPDGNAHGE